MSSGVSLDDLPKLIGTVFGPSDWIVVGQDRIDRFADVTGDHQSIHVDTELAARGPFGATVAHGFLTLSLLTRLLDGIAIAVDGATTGINYGFNWVRFLAPVISGSRVRAHGTLLHAGVRKPGQVLFRYDVTIEIENEETPALKAEWLVMSVVT